jgi:hypothetical protein
MVQENLVGLKLNGTYQLPVSADNVNLLTDNNNTTKKNTGVLTDNSKQIGLEVKTEKTNYMLTSCHHSAGQNRDIKMANTSFENVKFKYLGMTETNQNLIHEEINSTFNLDNTHCHADQNLLSSNLLSKNVRIKIYKTIILLVVPYGCET